MAPSLSALYDMTLDALVAEAERLGAPPAPFPWRDGLVAAVADRMGDEPHGCGVLEVHAEGFGFLRSPYDDLLPGQGDIYVSQSQIKRFGLRTGDTVVGRIRPPKETERYPALLRVDAVNGESPDTEVVPFEAQAAVHASTRMPLAHDPWLAAVDWVAPLGLGARGLLVAPTRSPRTAILRRLASTFAADPRIDVSVLLIGERPEDVTEWRESGDVEVIATPVDELASRVLHAADIAFARARRLAERGVEVLMLVDSLSRLLRCALSEASTSGQIEGVDAAALVRIRTWFATARDLDAAGSVTLVGTVDGDGDDALSGVLHRDLRDLATWQLCLREGPPGSHDRPDIDVRRSWTRREERLLHDDELARRQRWRAELGEGPAAEADALAALFRPSPLDSGSQAGQ